jgi:hypothetical protein
LRELALVKEYDLFVFVPLYDNDGKPVEPQPFQALQQLLDQFGGLTIVERDVETL